MKSVFTDKNTGPDEKSLKKALGHTFEHWQALVSFTKKNYPQATEAWHYTSEKYGWSYRISDKKRVLLYLLPRDRFFKVAFVFGQKASDQILASHVAESIKEELSKAKVYAEGRGIRLEVKDKTILPDLKELIKIKIAT